MTSSAQSPAVAALLASLVQALLPVASMSLRRAGALAAALAEQAASKGAGDELAGTAEGLQAGLAKQQREAEELLRQVRRRS